jgi:uncharacterized repeat protein (TIGR02543 family)
MPGNDVIVTANWQQIVLPPATYTVTVNGSYATETGAGAYNEGDTVTVKAGNREGYTFAGWKTDDGVIFANANTATTTFTMPGKSVTVTASWSIITDDEPEKLPEPKEPEKLEEPEELEEQEKPNQHDSSEIPPMPTTPLDENGVPLGEWRWDEEKSEWIFDKLPPLTNPDIPQTDASETPITAFMFLIISIVLMGGAIRKEKRV